MHPHLEPGTVLADRFRVVRLLGAGGMGSVYEVEHELTKHRRALKLLHGELAHDSDVVGRFLREASAAGRIGSKHIVETFDAGKLSTGEPYLVMELLQGQTLEQKLQAAGGRLPLYEGLRIVAEAALGIHAAHAAGIVHRDVKPENLFVVSGSPDTVKVLDFGISKFDPARTGTPSLTVEGLTMGTPHYMSPEQVRGQGDVGVPTDVYALGVVLYETVTGKKPFDAETLPALSVAIHEGQYAPVESLRPNVPPEVGSIIARALAGDPRDRYSSAEQLALALSNVMGASDTTAASLAAVPESHAPTLRVDSAALAMSMPPSMESGKSGERPRAELEHTQLSADLNPGSAETNRGVRRWVVVASVLILGGAAAALLAQRARVTTETEPEATPSAPPGVLSTAPVVLPDETPPKSQDRASPPASTTALPPQAGSPTPQARPTAAPAPQPPASNGKRVKEHGLGTEDPFKN